MKKLASASYSRAEQATLPLKFSAPSVPFGEPTICGQAEIYTSGGRRFIFAGGRLFWSYEVGDRIQEHLLIVALAKGRIATQTDIAIAFGIARKTVYNYQQASKNGIDALERKPGTGIPPKVKSPGRPRKVTAEIRKFLESRRGCNMSEVLQEVNDRHGVGLSPTPVYEIWRQEAPEGPVETNLERSQSEQVEFLFASESAATESEQAEPEQFEDLFVPESAEMESEAGPDPVEGRFVSESAETESKQAETESKQAEPEQGEGLSIPESAKTASEQAEQGPRDVPDEVDATTKIQSLPVRAGEVLEQLIEAEMAPEVDVTDAAAAEPASNRDESGLDSGHDDSDIWCPDRVVGTQQAYGGAWLMMPYLKALGWVEIVQELYAPLQRTRFFGLKRIFVALFFMVLLKFTTLQSFGGVLRGGFGRLLGVRCSPSLKTMRRKLVELSEQERGISLVSRLARNFARIGLVNLGVLYIDGHFVPYFGKRKLAKGYYSIRRMPHRGVEQFFVGDQQGRPLFFALQEGNTKLNKYVPSLLEEIRRHTGENGKKLTLVFDREGATKKLLRWLDDPKGGNVTFITYGKGFEIAYPGGAFRPVQVPRRRGRRSATFYACATRLELEDYGRVRLIVIKKGKKQTPVLTNDFERSVEEIVSLIALRWGQENFFKYMMRHYELNAIHGFSLGTVDEELQVPNPAHKQKTQEIRKVNARIKAAKHSLGELSEKVERGKATEDQEAELESQRRRLRWNATRRETLLAERRALPKEISYGELQPEERRERLQLERKILLDAAKIAAYNGEEWLMEHFAPGYKDWREQRAVLRRILQARADLQVEDGSIIVTLERLQPEVVARGMELLCERLNQEHPTVWDGSTPIQYRVAGSPADSGRRR